MPSSGSKVWEAGELLRGVTTCENNVSGRFQFDILQEERVESPHPINTWRAIGVYINRWQPNSLLAGPAAYFWFPIIISWWWLWGPFGGEHSLSDCVNFNVDVLFMTRSSLSLFNSRSRLLWVSPVKRGHLSIRATPIADLPVDTSRRGGVRRVNKSCVTQSNPAYIPLLGTYTKWPKNCWWTRRQQPGGWIKTTPPTSTMEINRLPAAPPIRPSFTFVTSPDFGFKEWV